MCKLEIYNTQILKFGSERGERDWTLKFKKSTPILNKDYLETTYLTKLRMMQSDGIMGKEGKMTTGGYKEI